MNHAQLPDDVRALIASHIDSVVQVEVLLLLSNSPDQEWSPEAIARELRIDPAWAADQLAQLATRGLLAAVPGEAPRYIYRPQTPELARAAQGLARAYADRRVSVISEIYSKPVPATPPAPATDPLKSFADAFRIRKENRDG